MIWNLRFRAMGTRAHLLVEGEPELLPPACRRIERLERLWSRFIADSEVSRLNGAGGAAVPVAPETAELLARAEEGWRMTEGQFDPTLRELIAAGYDRDFDEVRESDSLAGDRRGETELGRRTEDRLVKGTGQRSEQNQIYLIQSGHD